MCLISCLLVSEVQGFPDPSKTRSGVFEYHVEHLKQMREENSSILLQMVSSAWGRFAVPTAITCDVSSGYQKSMLILRVDIARDGCRKSTS